MKLKHILLLLIIQSSFVYSQNTDSTANSKATVYFTRASSLGALINFTYFDGENPIGRFNGPKYLKYVCDPGEHLFWARSENKSFVEANLEGGKIYIIDVIPQLGGIKAGVRLVPVDKSIYKLKKIQKLVSNKESVKTEENELQELKTKMSDVINRGLARYEEIKNKGKILKLTPELTVLEQDLVFEKKKKEKKKKKK